MGVLFMGTHRILTSLSCEIAFAASRNLLDHAIRLSGALGDETDRKQVALRQARQEQSPQ